MNAVLVLASNTVGPVVLALFLAPIAVGLICLMLLAVRRRGGGRSRWGLVLGLVPTAVGVLVIFFLLTVRGGAPYFFYIAAALPLLVGIKILQVWSRPREPK